MSIEFFNPLNAAKSADAEGHVGQYAGFYLPFYGYWFASGQQYTFLTGEIPQKPSKPILGLSRPDTFQKDCCGCKGAVGLV